MSSDTKILLVIAALTVGVIGFIVLNSGSATQNIDPAIISRGGVATGSATPKVTLTEFSDFFCPACHAANPTVDQIIQKDGNQVKFVYRHFPLPQHPLAFKAAQAAEAANLQDKFWIYRDKLFDLQDSLTDASFEQIAKDLGLDVNKFKADMDSTEVIKKVQLDADDAKKLNLPGTPSFFVNGEKIEFATYADLVKAVEDKLK